MKRQGFTLIELLIVIAIIGIVAAIAIPNLLTALQKSKQKATMGDLKSLGTAVESYITDNYMAPFANGAVSQITVNLQPFYIKAFPLQDGWGNSFMYESVGPGADQDIYSLHSYGRDGQPGGIVATDSANSPYIVSSMPGFTNDIVYSNGAFTFAPKVK